MIATIYLSKKFLLEIIVKNLFNNDNFAKFIRKIIEDDTIFLIGDNKYLDDLLKKHKENLIGQKQFKHLELLTRLYKKPNWTNYDPKNKNISFDYHFLSELENINSNENNMLSFKKIVKNSEKILKKISTIKQEPFDIELKVSKKYQVYKFNDKEINKFKKKILSSMNVSKKIIIWDQYIPSSLAFIHKTRKELYRGTFYKDYCSTLEYLDREIFSKTLLKNTCEIITMNKLEQNIDYKKFTGNFNKFAQNYLNKIKLTKSKLIIKKYDNDLWVDLHSRLMIFEDGFNQLVSYFVVEPGMDFIKLEKVSHYNSKNNTRNKFRYRFTPGTKVAYNSKISIDLKKIYQQSGYELRNIA